MITDTKEPQDPYWNRKAIHINEAIKHAGTKGEGVKVAIIDTGIDYTIPSLSERFNPENKGYNFVKGERTSDPMDINGHGTTLAQIVADAIFGLANQTSIFSLKVSNTQEFEVKTVNHAIYWGIENAVDLINLSCGGLRPEFRLEKACMDAYDSGIILVAAAGNNAVGPLFPSVYENIISVGALGRNLQRCSFSNVWSSVDLMAPGTGFHPILGKRNHDGTEMEGTSYAVPHVVGAISVVLSLLKSRQITYTPSEITKILRDSCQPIDLDDQFTQQASEWLQTYESRRIIFPMHTTGDQEVLRTCMYGSGLLRVDNFAKTAKEFYGIGDK